MKLIDEEHTEKYSDIKEQDIDPEDQKSVFSFTVEATFTVRFSESFKNYERKYGQVYFITYDEVKDEVCPICKTNDYKQDIVIADDEVFVLAYEDENGKVSWYTISDILENTVCKSMQRYANKIVDKNKNELKRIDSNVDAHEKRFFPIIKIH